MVRLLLIFLCVAIVMFVPVARHSATKARTDTTVCCKQSEIGSSVLGLNIIDIVLAFNRSEKRLYVLSQ